MQLSWENLLERIEHCQKCTLCSGIHNKVPGQGNTHAKLMFIGEGPGADEDMQGLAFVGAAGKLLTKMIGAMGYTREDVYICNVVKCRPPHNRAPELDEMESCMPYLREQFLLVHPKVIVLLGATAAKAVLGDHIRITRDRGKWVEKKGFYFMPTYHPAALLRDESKKKDAWEDLKQVMKKLSELEEKDDALA
ncbi:MAG: uracil-DNA glycosylase [Clostridia bacterium]|nr:uracil-DNA glycosylase [Clostridia bacterium]